MGASGFMATSSVTQATTSLAAADAQSRALQTQGSWAEMQGKANARLAELQQADALKRGDLAAGQVIRGANQVKGQQRASAVGQGIDVSSGVAQDLQNETEVLSALDVMNVKNNALREAFGFEVQKINSLATGKMQKAAAKNEARSTLLVGGLNALSAGARAAGYASDTKLFSSRVDSSDKSGLSPDGSSYTGTGRSSGFARNYNFMRTRIDD